MDVINDWVVQLFSSEEIGFQIALGIVVACFVVTIWVLLGFYFPFSRQLKARLRATKFLSVASSSEDAQVELASKFGIVDAAMSKGRRTDSLRHAWVQFKDTIASPPEGLIRSTARPEDYFLHFGSHTRILGWWANIFVAAGIICTFLGIIAALLKAVDAMQSSADTTNMQRALVGLLTITAAKFWTSVAGVGSSIFLRLVDRICHSLILAKLGRICRRLERGMLFSPMQSIATEQLQESKQQTVALQSFSTQLAVAIGDQFESRMQPMVTVLSGIQSSINDFKTGTFGQIGKELGEAISRSAGSEMQQLAAALTTMTTSIASVNDKVENSGQQASEQIAKAAQEFSAAAELMARTFATANAGIDDMSGRLTQQADAAAERNANVLSSATSALQAMVTQTSAGLKDTLTQTISVATEESGRVMSSAFASFGEGFDKASGRLVETLQTTAGRMEALAGSIERSATASRDHAVRLDTASQGVQDVTVKLGQAANDIQGAAAPVRDATAAVGTSLARMQEILRGVAESSARSESAMQAIATSLSQTSDAAGKAWSDYHRRFEDVDKALAAAINQINTASGEHARNLTTQVGQMDNLLADSVNRLASALDPLTELASALEDVQTRMARAS